MNRIIRVFSALAALTLAACAAASIATAAVPDRSDADREWGLSRLPLPGPAVDDDDDDEEDEDWNPKSSPLPPSLMDGRFLTKDKDDEEEDGDDYPHRSASFKGGFPGVTLTASRAATGAGQGFEDDEIEDDEGEDGDDDGM